MQQDIESNFTLDKLFSNQIDAFKKEENRTIEKSKVRINSISEKIKNCQDEDKIAKYKTKIKSLENKINCSQQKINDYLLSNSEHLFEYFITKQNIEKNNNPKKALDNFFKKIKKEDYITHSK